jgi:hypothetical protein
LRRDGGRVERLFALPTDKKTGRGIDGSVNAPRIDLCSCCIGHRNAEPKPAE